ncbi:radical SAM protein [Poseidonibacter parvus]|uniref:Radical SAM protein n=1 Tax=Poseidonibacter parvus TaxID=1850254 RepID=A0A1P8KKW4_9BACT|nr:radical SAM protein [Poseidonibacter parvus]APW65203.1 radical SAM protein [Poseidonibacter parvus]
MIEYNQPLYRPPAEANSVIIQVTLGCSFNKCTFCTMYESKDYKVRKLEDVFKDIDTMASFYQDSVKMFLADGDALNMETNHLIKILDYAYLKFPKLRRVSVYASAFNLNDKSLEELKLLKEKGLNLIYYGIESGSYEVLKKIQKPISQIKMIDSLNKAYQAGLKTSVTVILGLAGKKYSFEHIKETANIINQVKVTYLSTLQLMLEEGRYQKFIKNFDGGFKMLNEKEMLEEQKSFLEQLNPSNKVIFRSNHVSNSLALAGTIPKDKTRLIEELSFILKSL